MLLSIGNYMLTCPSKYLTGIDCPGCGFQRSIVALFEGRLWESLTLYPATIPFFVCLIFTLLHLKFDFKNGAAAVKFLFIFYVSVVTIFYIYKIITHKIF
ncbi:MAG: DUF2752 domain-containing protein [Prevotellaceae bacterium]|nr:DUF2752 domain-containing protein [Prevotellaceae bacterium]